MRKQRAVAVLMSLVLTGTVAPVAARAASDDGREVPVTRTGDADGDGVHDATDACPSVPGARPVAEGCAAIDLVRFSHIFMQRQRAAIDTARQALDTDRYAEMTSVDQQLRAAADALGRAGERLGRGEACAGAGTERQAVDHLTNASRRMAGVVTLERRRVRAAASEDASGDADEHDLEWHQLGLARTRVEAALTAGRSAAELFDASCASSSELALVDRATDIRDDAGLVELQSGGTIALPSAGLDTPLAGGVRYRFTGIRFDDGTSMVTQANPIADNHEEMPKIRCVDLAVAPFQQALADSEAGPVVVHPMKGYVRDGLFQVEDGGRFVADQRPTCPTETGVPGRSLRYTLYVSLIYTNTAGNSAQLTMAHDLRDGELSAPFPPHQTGGLSSLLVATRVQKCTLLDCSFPTTLTFEQFPMEILEKRSQCSVAYESTVFDLP